MVGGSALSLMLWKIKPSEPSNADKAADDRLGENVAIISPPELVNDPGQISIRPVLRMESGLSRAGMGDKR